MENKECEKREQRENGETAFKTRHNHFCVAFAITDSNLADYKVKYFFNTSESINLGLKTQKQTHYKGESLVFTLFVNYYLQFLWPLSPNIKPIYSL